MTAIITSVINWKGGVGKTTLTHHLGTGLNYRRKRTLLIDLDPQCNLSTLALGYESYHQKTAHGTLTIKSIFELALQDQLSIPNDLIQVKSIRSSPNKVYTYADLILSHMDLTEVDLKLAGWSRNSREYDHTDLARRELDKLTILRDLLEPLRGCYDYIFLDCPANLHLVTQNALIASDNYLVPVTPDYLSTVGLAAIRHQIEALDSRYARLKTCVGETPAPKTRLLGVIFNKIQEYGRKPTQAHQQAIENVKAQIGAENVFEHYLLNGDGIQRSAAQNLPVYSLEGSAKTLEKAQRQIASLHNLVFEYLRRTSKEVPV